MWKTCIHTFGHISFNEYCARLRLITKSSKPASQHKIQSLVECHNEESAWRNGIYIQSHIFEMNRNKDYNTVDCGYYTLKYMEDILQFVKEIGVENIDVVLYNTPRKTRPLRDREIGELKDKIVAYLANFCSW
ncbi:uncharacterized protein LOC130820280 [Amaranthus tricolor]|uniref:uncharacterized protein LOC130820280 n=1 Tax=Amaranthus tricolor TaxID=29722 RepID=UPI00258DECE4|nr:uncharacterized protein LOC130820280 [Amaranthus tricolor]